MKCRAQTITVNVFCKKGKGGGVDPTCTKGGSTAKLEIKERKPNDPFTESSFSRTGELIRGHIAGIPVTSPESGVVGKISKKTVAALEASLGNPDIIKDLKAAGIKEIKVVTSSYYAKKTGGKAGNWTAAYSNGVLIIHTRTAESIAKSPVPEKVKYGMDRVITHEAGHGTWDNAKKESKDAFIAAVNKHPEIGKYVSAIVNTQENRNAFNPSSEKKIHTESFAEMSALRRYNNKLYETFPKDMRDALELAHQESYDLSVRMESAPQIKRQIL